MAELYSYTTPYSVTDNVRYYSCTSFISGGQPSIPESEDISDPKKSSGKKPVGISDTSTTGSLFQ